MNPWGFAIIAAGLFTAAGGFFDWDWYMENTKAKVIVSIIGRTGARIFYMLVGLGFAVAGFLLAIGVFGPE